MMRPSICFVSDTIHTYFDSGIKSGAGGAERQQYMLAKELNEQGYDVSVATLEDESTHRVTSDGIEIWHVIPGVRGLVLAPYKAVRTIQALRQINADIYYVRGNDFLCILISLFCKFSDSKFVYAIASDGNIDPSFLKDQNSILSHLYLSAISRADSVTVLTPHQQDLLAEEHGVQSRVIPCGYDLPDRTELIDHTNREYVLWVGRLDPDSKRPKRFIELAESLPSIQFKMIGPPDNDDLNKSYFNEIKRQTDAIENLQFIDFVPPDEIHEYFRKASILVNTSDYEGFGNVFLEAWRYATPVVTLNYTLHGVITKQNVGLKAESVGHLTELVSELHNNPERRRKMGNLGRELVQAEYSKEFVVAEYKQIFSELQSTSR